MMKTYQEEFLLRTCNCDFRGTWRPGAILEAMQETAGMHSELLDVGRSRLIRRNTVWVLSRSEVQMDRYPGIGDRVSVETFPKANRRWFFPRYFLFKNQAGETLGRAASLWVLLDIENRRMLAPTADVLEKMPDNSDLPAPMGLPGTVEDVEGEEQTLLRLPRYADLDVNGHVNNTRYADWACDALGIEVMRNHCLETMQVNYDAEVRPDQEITLQVKRDGLRYRVAGYYEEKMHFELGGRLRPRE